MIEINCPSCGRGLKIDVSFAGKSGRCQHCNQRIAVPDENGGYEINNVPVPDAEPSLEKDLRLRGQRREGPISRRVAITVSALALLICATVLIGKQVKPEKIEFEYESIHEAATNGAIEDVRDYLEIGTPVDALDGNGSTPLRLASLYGHASVVELLLDMGADANPGRSEGSSLIFFLILRDSDGSSYEIVKLLCENGAVIEKDSLELFAATLKDDSDLIDLLIQYGADPNEGGQALAVLSKMQGSDDAVKALIQGGLELNLDNLKAFTIGEYISESQKEEPLKEMEAAKDVAKDRTASKVLIKEDAVRDVSGNSLIYGSLESKILTYADTAGNIRVSLRLPVRNVGAAGTFYASVRATDVNDFELTSTELYGYFGEDQPGFLTRVIIMNEYLSLQVSELKIEEVAFVESPRPYSASNIETRLISDVDISGDVWFSIKADISLQALSEGIYVTLRALDGEGFELKSVIFEFDPAPSKKIAVSTRIEMPYANYMSINSWATSSLPTQK